MMFAKQKQAGFTIIELVIVVILLGIVGLGITGFMTLSTQTYINVNERDQILSDARFAIERLNREVRNSVPNSVRVNTQGGWHCMEFLPIDASTIYTDIPVAPEAASNELSVISFVDQGGNEYQCGAGCRDIATVYPLQNTDIYKNVYSAALSTGKIFWLNGTIDKTDPTVWQLETTNGAGVTFDEDSPTKRMYISSSPVSYCTNDASGLWRFTGYNMSAAQPTPPIGNNSLMAENLANYDAGNPFFVFQPATLRRNAVVKIRLPFTRDGERLVFENEIHIANTP